MDGGPRRMAPRAIVGLVIPCVATGTQGARYPRRRSTGGVDRRADEEVRRSGADGSVDPANEPADLAGSQPGAGIDLEETGAAIGAAEEP